MEQITNELEEIVKKLQSVDNISDDKYIQAALATPDCALCQYLRKTLLSTDFKKVEAFFEEEKEGLGITTLEYFDERVKSCAKNGKTVNSLSIFAYIIEHNLTLSPYFKQFGITRVGIANESIKSIGVKASSVTKRKSVDKMVSQPVKPLSTQPTSNGLTRGAAEKTLINLNDEVNERETPFFFGKTDIIDSIWESCMTKCNRTMVVKGEFGKENLLSYLAYLLKNNLVPYHLKDYKLLKVDFPSLTNDIAIKGVFETRFRKVIEDAASKGKYILVVDNTEGVIEDETYKEFHFELMVKEIVAAESIPLLILGKPTKAAPRHRYKSIDLDKYTNSELYEIASKLVGKLQNYHNVVFEEQLLVKLFNKINCDTAQYNLLYQLLDNIAASRTKDNVDEAELNRLRDEISDISAEIENILDNMNIIGDENPNEEDLLSDLEEKRLEANARLRQKEKEINTKKVVTTITCDDMRRYLQSKMDSKREVCSSQYSVWLNYLNENSGKAVEVVEDDSKSKLKSLNDDIRGVVIGQDEAIEELCQVVKRHQLGFNLEKPSVVLCTGSTGVGKSYLCKTIAKKVFGSDKYLVRLDMSEYAEKNSVSKLYGTSAGYVGYENGGILTEAVKKTKKGILLLDEIEKAHSEVFDAFLQVFDEGRLTDNHGETVSFKDFIIVMTSNVGAEESSRNQGGIGFKKQDVNEYKRDVIEKVMKSRFKPEFLNRIDKVVHFSSLTEDNLKSIIRLELDKMVNNIKTIGYAVAEDSYGDELVDFLFDKVKDDKEYGARPIIRVIKSEVENRLIQKIIDDDLEKGYTFEKIWSAD